MQVLLRNTNVKKKKKKDIHQEIVVKKKGDMVVGEHQAFHRPRATNKYVWLQKKREKRSVNGNKKKETYIIHKKVGRHEEACVVTYFDNEKKEGGREKWF